MLASRASIAITWLAATLCLRIDGSEGKRPGSLLPRRSRQATNLSASGQPSTPVSQNGSPSMGDAISPKVTHGSTNTSVDIPESQAPLPVQNLNGSAQAANRISSEQPAAVSEGATQMLPRVKSGNISAGLNSRTASASSSLPLLANSSAPLREVQRAARSSATDTANFDLVTPNQLDSSNPSAAVLFLAEPAVPMAGAGSRTGISRDAKKPQFFDNGSGFMGVLEGVVQPIPKASQMDSFNDSATFDGIQLAPPPLPPAPISSNKKTSASASWLPLAAPPQRSQQQQQFFKRTQTPPPKVNKQASPDTIAAKPITLVTATGHSSFGPVTGTGVKSKMSEQLAASFPTTADATTEIPVNSMISGTAGNQPPTYGEMIPSSANITFAPNQSDAASRFDRTQSPLAKPSVRFRARPAQRMWQPDHFEPHESELPLVEDYSPGEDEAIPNKDSRWTEMMARFLEERRESQEAPLPEHEVFDEGILHEEFDQDAELPMDDESAGAEEQYDNIELAQEKVLLENPPPAIFRKKHRRNLVDARRLASKMVAARDNYDYAPDGGVNEQRSQADANQSPEEITGSEAREQPQNVYQASLYKSSRQRGNSGYMPPPRLKQRTNNRSWNQAQLPARSCTSSTCAGKGQGLNDQETNGNYRSYANKQLSRLKQRRERQKLQLSQLVRVAKSVDYSSPQAVKKRLHKLKQYAKEERRKQEAELKAVQDAEKKRKRMEKAKLREAKKQKEEERRQMLNSIKEAKKREKALKKLKKKEEEERLKREKFIKKQNEIKEALRIKAERLQAKIEREKMMHKKKLLQTEHKKRKIAIEQTEQMRRKAEKQAQEVSEKQAALKAEEDRTLRKLNKLKRKIQDATKRAAM